MLILIFIIIYYRVHIVIIYLLSTRRVYRIYHSFILRFFHGFPWPSFNDIDVNSSKSPVGPISGATAAVWETDCRDFFSKPKDRLRRPFTDLVSQRIIYFLYLSFRPLRNHPSKWVSLFKPIFNLHHTWRLSVRRGHRRQRSTQVTTIIDDRYLLCFRMLFAGIRETLSKFAQSPFGVVRAEEELVDPAKVLRVSSMILLLCYHDIENINVLCIFRKNVNKKKKPKNDLPNCKNVILE